MQQLSVKVSSFEGPLDLLIHLIEKDKIDIYDIPIVSITEQYISYLKQLSEFDMELASEFLVMAATLLQIKSRMLLPKNNTSDEEEEADPRQMLVEMLVEYRKIKSVASKLAEMKQDADKYYARKPMFDGICQRVLAEYKPEALLKALAGINNYRQQATAYIRPQAFSVQDKMQAIMKRLSNGKQGFRLDDLFQTQNRGEKVAAFLGVLELLKLGLITINQSRRFAPIYIFAKQGEH